MNKIYRIKTETGHIFTRHSEADALKLAEARGGEITVYVELAELEAVKAQRDELYRRARNAVSVATDMGIYYDVGAGEMKALESAVNEVAS